ncbi:plastidic glucose transporter 4-like [Durio zibethinus]|uniref:Plastidic glucose transporter 4-like n=1 Tax=Durio zibethinus TaxID=66656 RepID=A0A6P5ZI94_DURZI|nr:plastidic glucose transporter 4-like [Durio zibethinus]
MQASTHLIKGNLGFELSKQTVLPCFGKVTERNLTLNRNLWIRSGSICSGLNSGAVSMGTELARARNGIETVVRSSVKSRSVKAQVVSTLLAGATVGSFTGGELANKFGWTRTFQLNAIPLTIEAVLTLYNFINYHLVYCHRKLILQNALNVFSDTAQTVQTMIIGHLPASVGIGISSAIVPLCISEISPTEIRGALGSINQLFICIGILAALVAGLPIVGNPLWWRTMFGIAAVPSILLALRMAFSLESPRWLFQQGKIPEAEKSVRTLNGKERVAEVMYELRTAGQGSTKQEYIGVEYGKGFETLRLDGPLKVDVDYLNDRLQEGFLKRIHYTVKPNEAYGLMWWVVNDALEYLSKDLGIAENTVMQGGGQCLVLLLSHLFYCR